MSPDRLYFAYGSNLSVAQMRKRCPDSAPWRTARLPHYRLAFGNASAYRKGGVATILPDGNGCHTPGLLYRLTAADLARLDEWESYPKKYDRFEADLMDAHGERQRAWTYLLNDYYPHAPSAEYLGLIEAGYEAHGLSPEGLRAALAEAEGQSRERGSGG